MLHSRGGRALSLVASLVSSLVIATACNNSSSSRGGDRTPPVTTVIAPNGGEIVRGMQNITWTTADAAPGNVEIRISNDSGATYANLLDPAALDTGTYPVDTTAVPDGGAYRVRVTPTDRSGNVGAPGESAGDFTIDNTAPVVTLTMPVGGEFWRGPRNIMWTTTDANPGTVDIAVSTDSGLTFATVLATGALDTGSYNWDTFALSDSNTLRIRVTPTDLAGGLGADAISGADFAVDNTLPVIALTSPVGGELWAGPQTITWTSTEVNPDFVAIALSPDSGASYSISIDLGAPDGGSYAWDTATQSDGFTFRVRLIATDLAGNFSVPSDSPGDFAMDNTPPVTTLTAPTGGEVWSGFGGISWFTTEANPGTVDIFISVDSGGSYVSIGTGINDLLGLIGWDSTTVGDTRTARIRLIPTDAAGNVGLPADSPLDFEVNNIPHVTGFARYVDVDRDGIATGNDQIILAFDMDVVVNGAVGGDFSLPVAGDSLGTAPSVSPGPAPTEVTLSLGTGPLLKSRQTFDPGSTLPNSPSGIDVSPGMALDAIESASAGIDAAPSTPVDLFPGFVLGSTVAGASIYGVAFGDLDADGDLDAAGGHFLGANPVLLNTGTGA